MTHRCLIPLRINTLRPRQNGRHFPDDIFKWIFLNEIIWISIKISLKFVPGGRINNIPALVQIMAWRRPGDKPLSELMMVCSLTHICVTRPQWVKVFHLPWLISSMCVLVFTLLDGERRTNYSFSLKKNSLNTLLWCYSIMQSIMHGICILVQVGYVSTLGSLQFGINMIYFIMHGFCIFEQLVYVWTLGLHQLLQAFTIY